MSEDFAEADFVVFENGSWQVVPPHCTVFEIINDPIYLLFRGGVQKNIYSDIFWDELEGASGGVGDFFV